jgi:hypothetical protein
MREQLGDDLVVGVEDADAEARLEVRGQRLTPLFYGGEVS